MENIVLLLMGILFIVLGGVNMTGNISTVHAYNRRKVREEDIPKYGRAVGIGTAIVGLGLVLASVLSMLGFVTAMPFVLIAAIAVGLVFILYAQFKYNKGIF